MTAELTRAALDRLLGAGRFQVYDSSAIGQRRRVLYPCGCVAREVGDDHYDLVACERHRESFETAR